MSSSGSSRKKTQSSQIHVSIEHGGDKKEKDTILLISGRPPTHMGSQGDHASAYYLIKKEKPIENILNDLFVLAENSQTFKERHLTENNTLKSLQKEIVTKLTTATEIIKTQQLEKDIIDIIKSYLTIRNKLPYTAFPTEGNIPPPTGEGARIKTAANQLNILSEFLAEQKSNDTINYIDLSKKITQQMFELFWYPKIPKKLLLSPAKWDTVKDNYNKGTKPRDNNLDTLYEVTANHIDLVLTCYPEFTHPREFVNQIVENFVTLVASKGTIKNVSANWSMSKKESEIFNQQVLIRLVLGLGREELNKSASESASSNSASNTSPAKTLSSPSVTGTVTIHQMLNIPVTPAQHSLTSMMHADSKTPVTTTTDISYAAEDSLAHSSNDEEEATEQRATRSQDDKSSSDHLTQTLSEAKKLNHTKGNL